MQTADACLRGKVGRNEPCPCGSRKKYKKCCLPRDEEQEREELRTQEFQRWGGHYQEEGEDACECPTCGAVHHDHDSDGEENDEDREEYARSDDDPLPPVLDVLARYLGKRGMELDRAFVDKCIAHGEGIIDRLAAIAEEPRNWCATEAHRWAAFHATMILGAIGGEAAAKALIDALLYSSDERDDEMADFLPSIFGSIGSLALPDLVHIAENIEEDWYVRSIALGALTAVALREAEARPKIFLILANIMRDPEEDQYVRSLAGMSLLDCVPSDYRSALRQFAREQEEDEALEPSDVLFGVDDVRLAYYEGLKDTGSYRQNWLDYYAPERIDERCAERMREERNRRWYWRLIRRLHSLVGEKLWRWRMRQSIAIYVKERERRIAALPPETDAPADLSSTCSPVQCR